MGELKRYECGMDRMGITTFEEQPTGEWVKHSDAAAKIADLERAVEVLAKDVADLSKFKYLECGRHYSTANDFVSRDTLDNPIAKAALEAARRTNG